MCSVIGAPTGTGPPAERLITVPVRVICSGGGTAAASAVSGAESCPDPLAISVGDGEAATSPATTVSPAAGKPGSPLTASERT